MSNDENPVEEVLQPLLGSGAPGSVTRRQARHDELAARLDAGVDPEYIRDFENFHSMEHAEIYRIAQTISPVAMTTLAGEWAKLGKGFSLAIALGTVMIRDRIARHWEGDAATAALTATARFGDSAQQLCDAAQAVSQKLHIAADVGERVKSSIPPPAERIPSAVAALNPVTEAEAVRQAEAIRVQSVRVMESLYKPYYRDSGAAVPVLPPPYVAATGAGGENAHGARRLDDTTGARASETGTPVASRLDADERADPGTGPSNTGDSPGENAANTSPRTSKGGAPPGAFEDSGPATTTPAGAAGPTPLPGQTSASPQSGLPAGLGTSGNAGIGSTGSGGGGVSSPWGSSLGGLAGGAPVSTGTDRPGQTAAAGSRNGVARPMGMYPGMVPPGATQSSDEQRRVPSYLVTNDHGNELIGSMPDTAPPVLGADPA
ncbi:hypothetical protein ACIBED_09720 [Rhodococcus coprophilus]|uniref:hypothetical protein n=1 Tax=Rhodococcus coprophilus TaxID=38310 RepID=UPI0037A91CD6